MKRIIPAVMLAMVLAVFASVPGVFAATEVSVTLNGDSLRYTNVQPQIINDRTMVPIRETAEFLGMTSNWDSASSTMTFTSKNGKTFKHTLYQNTMIVNGVTKSYDTPSTVVDEWSLMPIRMLADAIDAKVEWDSVRYRVDITKSMNPAITTALPEKTAAIAGSTLSVQVLANSDTDMVKLTDNKSAVLGTSERYVESGSTRIFTVSIKAPAEDGSQMVMVYAGAGGSYSASPGKTFTLTVEAKEEEQPASTSGTGSTGTSMFSGATSNSGGNVAINSYTLSSNSVSYGTTITGTAYTGDTVVKMWVEDANGDTQSSTTTYTTSGNEYKWSLSFTAKKTGDHYIYAQNKNGERGYERVYITVDGSSSNYSGTDDLKINDYRFNPYSVDYGKVVTVTVYTSNSARKVWVVDPRGDTVDTSSSYTSSGSSSSEYTWTLHFNAYYSGRYYVYASDNNNREVSDYDDITVGN